ncbi:uncharacterized protein LOC110028479 [Phalaenopsis equestris]|uniref:uncharacterized protein LOC110028479 n=1 Tax=Phalaenopsis equestris TaxID=78828 RepID=UPI0009E630CE|nr:uncharacterized protein LOC110028479 [Phalaenopsis equestris]
MLRALNSTFPSTSFTKLFVSRSTLLFLFHSSFSSKSKKMEGRRKPYTIRSNIDSGPDPRSASLSNSSLNSMAGQSASPHPRSRSPQPLESQREQISPKKTISVGPKSGRGSEPEEGPFDICRPAIGGPIGLKKSHLILNTEKRKEIEPVESRRKQISPKKTISVGRKGGRGSEPEEGPFDICQPAIGGPIGLKKSLLVLNREKRKELKRVKTIQYVRPGMVLLKNFICQMDQEKIVNKCSELGRGVGGFYTPGYRDGAKLHLRMMCLGQDWDPESRSYGKSRSVDGAVPPEIPQELRKLVDEALNASHEFLREKGKNVEEIPKMSPDICIVNFYSSSGKLGLHQDRDEGEESLRKGLPVVSFSIGDSAAFLYSDERGVEKAEMVMLESGDVLIFGGSSRHIFHGVQSIQPNTAPEILIEKTRLRPGRLNLTFRQY